MCNFLHKYVESPVITIDIDRTHQILRRTNAKNPYKPPDIIVKFVSYRTEASILTKVPMEKLRNDNVNSPY